MTDRTRHPALLPPAWSCFACQIYAGFSVQDEICEEILTVLHT